MRSNSAGKASLPVSVDPLINAASVADRVMQAITGGIRSGAFVPGQHLPESELTHRLEVSRASLREALGHLAAAGIVALNRIRGAYISTLDLRSTPDLPETLEPLARLAARLAAERCDTNEKRRRMNSAAASIEHASRGHNRAQYLEERRHFYNTLIEIGDNMIYALREPRVISVLDWELSTLGHPLADFAYHAMMFRMPPDIVAGLAGSDLAALNIPSEAEYLDAYCRRTGRSTPVDYEFCIAFSFFRMAAIFHGIKGRVIRGTAASAQATERARKFPVLARLARQSMETCR